MRCYVTPHHDRTHSDELAGIEPGPARQPRLSLHSDYGCIGPARGSLPAPKPLLPRLTPDLVDRLVHIVTERVIARLGLPPLHGGGQGFESPQLHHSLQLPNLLYESPYERR